MATTKYTIVGFRKSPPGPTLTVTKGSVIKLVDSYKYVLTVINSKHCFERNADVGFFSKYSSVFSSLRKINPVNATMMTLIKRLKTSFVPVAHETLRLLCALCMCYL